MVESVLDSHWNPFCVWSRALDSEANCDRNPDSVEAAPASSTTSLVLTTVSATGEVWPNLRHLRNVAVERAILHEILATIHRELSYGVQPGPFLRWEIPPEHLPELIAETTRHLYVQRLDDLAIDDTVPAGILHPTDQLLAVLQAFEVRVLIVAPRTSPPTVIVAER